MDTRNRKQPATTITARRAGTAATPADATERMFYVSARQTLLEQLAAMDKTYAEVKAIIRNGLKLETKSGVHYRSSQALDKSHDDAWSWLADYLANKCLSLPYFLSDRQAIQTPLAVDMRASDAENAYTKARQALRYQRGVEAVPDLIAPDGQTIGLFDAVRKQIREGPLREQPKERSRKDMLASPVADELREAAIGHLDTMEKQVHELAAILGQIYNEHRNFRGKSGAERAQGATIG